MRSLTRLMRAVAHRYRRLTQRMGHRKWVADVAKRVLPPLDRAVHRVSRGRVRFADTLFPTLLLTTTGRRSGLPRTQPLAYLELRGSWAVLATNFGQAHHPAWSHNLLAEPRATVQIGTRTHAVVARPATEDEQRELWARFVQMWPAYETYRGRAGRDIRMFVLDPTGDASAQGRATA